MTKLIFKLFLFVSLFSFAQEKNTANKDKEFIEFLKNSLKKEVNNDKAKNTFFKESRAYWKNRKLDYNLHPESYKEAISLYYQNKEKFTNSINKVNLEKSKRLEKAVKNFKNFDDRNTFPQKPILFVGSSSIAGWKTAISFPELPVINRGIGGMNLTELMSFYDTLIKTHTPSIIAIYCDIDIEQGKSPEIAVNLFKKLVTKIKTDFPKTAILLLSMKPVMVDDFIGKHIRKNKMITNTQLLMFSNTEENVYYLDLATPMLLPNGKLNTAIFIEDGMHLNKLGYTIWNPIVRNKILEISK